MTTQSDTRLGTLFRDALVFGAEAHDGQRRKGTGVPYYSHPLQVAGIALEHGADEEQAAAALLHDVLEDTAYAHADLAARFSARVAHIVRGCSDTEDHESKGGAEDWKRRKERYLKNLREVSADVALVSCADKLHNARSIVLDLRTHGPTFLDERFTGKGDGTLWYYGELVETFRHVDVPPALRKELGRTVKAMRQLAAKTD